MWGSGSGKLSHLHEVVVLPVGSPLPAIAVSLHDTRSARREPSRGTWIDQPGALDQAFYFAVEGIARISERLLVSLETTAPQKLRQEEAAKAKARSGLRFGA